MNATYKVVRINRKEYHVVPIGYTGNGLEYRPYGTYSDCIRYAEILATQSARKSSGGRKPQHTVVRRGDTFVVTK